MFRKGLTVSLIFLGLALLLLPQTVPARAQEPTPENDANCMACHEHEYYFYDTGKYFCLCEAPMHCVYCHGGRTDSYEKDVAHEGIVLYPTSHHAERCQACHGEDYMDRVVTFATIAGISSSPVPIITATPAAQALTPGHDGAPAITFWGLLNLEPWRLGALVILGLALAGMVIFGYRCWKTDCQGNMTG